MYASVIHPGGAPEWVVKQWVTLLTSKPKSADELQRKRAALAAPLLRLISGDLAKRVEGDETAEDSIVSLMDVDPDADGGDADAY
jgi:hypothetical protein